MGIISLEDSLSSGRIRIMKAFIRNLEGLVMQGVCVCVCVCGPGTPHVVGITGEHVFLTSTKSQLLHCKSLNFRAKICFKVGVGLVKQ